jgi:hypothetical protein
MRPCGEADQAVLKFDLRELDKFRRLTEHKEIATARAMDYCATHQVCPPEWLVAAAASLMIDLLKREKTIKRGRTAGCIARLQHELWNAERWDAVKTVREIREKWIREDKVLKARPRPSGINGYEKHHLKRKKWLEQGTFACASKMLLGRDAFAGPSTIRASFRKIEATLKRAVPPAGAWFDDLFLKALGLQGGNERKGGRNILDIFDLT